MSTKTEIKVPGLRHLTNSAHLEKRIEAVRGVSSVELDHQRECAIIEHDNADPHELNAAVAEEGGRAGKS